MTKISLFLDIIFRHIGSGVNFIYNIIVTIFIPFSSCFICNSIFYTPFNTEMSTTWSTELKYPFMPKQKMTFINGVVKNPGRSALPDADAKYSRKVKVNNLIFTLPGELCETMSACYKADLNGDKVPDYVFVSIKVWNGRFAPTLLYLFEISSEYHFSTVDGAKVCSICPSRNSFSFFPR